MNGMEELSEATLCSRNAVADAYVSQETYDKAVKSLDEARTDNKPPFIGCGSLVLVVVFLSLALALCDCSKASLRNHPVPDSTEKRSKPWFGW